MAGGSVHPKSSSHKPPTPSQPTSRKSRWEASTSSSAANKKDPQSDSKSVNPKLPKPASNPNPSPRPNTGPSPRPKNVPDPILPGPAFPFPDLGPPPPPTYGFHMLERRTIVLADGNVRSYFALPPDYQDFPLPPRPPIRPLRFFPPMRPESPGRGLSGKRKYEEELKYGSNSNGVYGAGPSGSSPFRKDTAGEDSRAGKYMRVSGGGAHKNFLVVENELKKAFLHFVKIINENEADRKKYLGEGKHGRLHCVACGRSSKDFPDMHALVLHTYNSDNADLRVDHLGLHKALCVLRGWNYSKSPDNSKSYQFLPAEEAAANQDDLIIWPPTVIIHNTITGKGKEGRMEGLGNKAMDSKIRDLGCEGGKSKSLYGREGHLGITLIRFSGDQSGLKEALKLAEHFEKDNHGRKAWTRLQPVTLGKDDEKNPNLVKVERDGEKRRILYGYLGTAADLCKVDFDTKKKVKIESQRDYRSPN